MQLKHQFKFSSQASLIIQENKCKNPHFQQSRVELSIYLFIYFFTIIHKKHIMRSAPVAINPNFCGKMEGSA